MEDDKQNRSTPIEQEPGDSEIEAATKRLSERWGQPITRRGSSERAKIEQTLSHGRSRPVTVEVRRGPRRFSRSE